MSTSGIKSGNTLSLAFTVALVAFLQLLCLPTAYAQTQDLKHFDGAWWVSANSGERVGFLYALDDCFTYDERPAMWFDDTWTNYEKEISAYYASSPANRTASVTTVFLRFGKTGSTNRTKQRVERYGDEFWRAHSETARRGFLEGYFACRIRDKNAPRWSKPLKFYLEKLNDLYNVDDQKGEDAPEYAGSVASALDKLIDHQ